MNLFDVLLRNNVINGSSVSRVNDLNSLTYVSWFMYPHAFTSEDLKSLHGRALKVISGLKLYSD